MKVTMKTIAFFDVTQCNLVDNYQCFGLTCCIVVVEKDKDGSKTFLRNISIYQASQCHMTDNSNLKM
jgi:hypothetical protein